MPETQKKHSAGHGEPIPSLWTLLLVPSVFLSAAELLLLAGSSSLLDLGFMHHTSLLAPTILAYLFFSTLATLVCALLMRPAFGASRALRKRDPITQHARKQAVDVLSRCPKRLMLLRLSGWLGITGTTALFGLSLDDAPLQELLASLSLTLTTGVAGTIVWRVWIDTSLEGLSQAFRGADRPLGHPPRFTKRLLGRLYWSGLLCAAAGVAVLTLFIVHFLSPRRRALLLLVTYAPMTIVFLSAIWAFIVHKLSQPLARYESEIDSPSEDVFNAAFKSAQTLPYTFAIFQSAAWVIGGILLTVQCIWVFGMDVENAAILFAGSIITSLAVLLYEALWHRRLLRPLLQEMGRRHSLQLSRIRSPLSVRVKMLAGFGILTFFACATAIFWSFIQYRNLATSFIEKQAQLRLELLNDRLKTLEKLQQTLRARDVTGLLREDASATEGVYYYLTRTDKVFTFTTLNDVPPLPLRARTLMRRRDDGVLNLSRENLTGAFTRVKLKSGDHGAVAILYPGYRGRGPGLARQIKVLLIFFGFLLALTAGIVVLTVEDLTGPLKGLERRVDQMARGDLQRPVPAGLEVDEVGMLATAFEAMRQSLDEKLSTIGALNLGLERKVKERTSDLARANHELRDALETLTKTQDQLVRSEKLASIGELVAGIAHEINNPINAVTNCVRPLDDAVDDFLKAVDPNAPDAEEAQELSDDIRQILRVIRSGTNRIKRIVSALGSYSRTDAEEKTHVDIHAALEDALEITAHLLGESRVEKRCEHSGPVPGWPGQLEQVFVNLIANAAQALQGVENAQITIETALSDEEETLIVSISDNGPGIPEDVMPKIFDPFFTTKDIGAGTGLGLSISHDIITRHGGRIDVKSDPMTGTTFTVRLPTDSHGG